jgi:AAA domain
VRTSKATQWKDAEAGKPALCRKVSWWMDAATPEPDVLAAQIIQDCAAGRISARQTREELNEILSPPLKLPTIEDAAALISKPIVLPSDIIEGLIHAGGKVEIGGASKSYKTWLLIDLAVSVVTGVVWLNGYTTRKGRVLYVNFELPPAFCAKRIQTVCDERQLTLEPGMLSVLNLRGYVKAWAQLQSQLQLGQFALIILDPSYKLLRGRDENKAGDIAALLDEFEVLAVQTGAAVAFGAHYSKGNQAQKEAIDRVGGSGVFARDPDSILNFTRHEERDCFTVEMTLRNHPPQKPFVVRWQFPLFCVDSMLDPAKLKRAGRPREYDPKDLLELIDKPMRAAKIVKIAKEERGIPERRIYEFLRELKKAGLLKQPRARGPYEPV